jgi:CBS domain containing-hemolysin-like protein
MSVLTGFFAMEEFSIVSSRRNGLEQLAAKGRHGARVAIEIAMASGTGQAGQLLVERLR